MSSPDPVFTLGAWSEVGAGVYVAVAEPDTVNLGLVVGQDRCLLVDCGSSPAQGRAVRDAVAAVTDRPLAAVVVTHWHQDHAYGLGAFTDVPRLAHESVTDRLRSAEAADQARALGLAPADLALPDRDIVVAAGLDLGGRRVEVAQLGRGHTEGDLVVVVADADVVFAGDLVESAGGSAGEQLPAPWYGADSWPHEWPATLDGLVGLMTDTTRVVPGHGPAVDREFVFEARGRTAAVSGEIRRLAESGVAVEAALERGDWAFPTANVAAGIAPGYAQLGRRRLPLV